MADTRSRVYPAYRGLNKEGKNLLACYKKQALSLGTPSSISMAAFVMIEESRKLCMALDSFVEIAERLGKIKENDDFTKLSFSYENILYRIIGFRDKYLSALIRISGIEVDHRWGFNRKKTFLIKEVSETHKLKELVKRIDYLETLTSECINNRNKYTHGYLFENIEIERLISKVHKLEKLNGISCEKRFELLCKARSMVFNLHYQLWPLVHKIIDFRDDVMIELKKLKD